MKLILLSFTFIFLLSYQNIAQELGRYANPEAAGYDAERLEDLRNFIESDARTTGMLVLVDGKILFEHGNLKKLSYIASCRKSVLAMLYGKHVESGKIDLSTQIGEMDMDDVQGLLPIEKKAQIDHLITARSGVYHPASNGGDNSRNAPERGSQEPGTYYLYNNWDFNAAGHALEVHTGTTIYEEIESQLAIPLGMQDWKLKRQKKFHKKKRSIYPAYHMYFSTRDMARIGQLMLQDGYWEGKEILPTDWVQKIRSTVTPAEVVNLNPKGGRYPQMSYGYMWWIVPEFKERPELEGMYTASGYGGQFITVIPKLKMVVAHKTKLDLFSLLGWQYKATSEKVYFEMLYKLAEARISN